MASLLFGVTPTDPVTYLVGSAALGLAAVVAGYLPSRRAARLDPMVALRSDG
jgi:ABC-type antimicrobial peptide transport system permease subunit